VFASVLVALAGHAEGRDALVLAAQLADDEAPIVVAHVMATSADPLTGGIEAAARRRARLRDGGEEIYATLGPDPRVRYLPLSGLPFAEAVGRVSAELVALYPPGVPVLAPGELVTDQTLTALTEAAADGIRIAYAADPRLATLQVLK